MLGERALFTAIGIDLGTEQRWLGYSVSPLSQILGLLVGRTPEYVCRG